MSRSLVLEHPGPNESGGNASLTPVASPYCRSADQCPVSASVVLYSDGRSAALCNCG